MEITKFESDKCKIKADNITYSIFVLCKRQKGYMTWKCRTMELLVNEVELNSEQQFGFRK